MSLPKEKCREEGFFLIVTAVAGAILWGWMLINQGLDLIRAYQTDPNQILQIVAFGISSFLFLLVLWMFVIVGLRLVRTNNI